MRRSKIGRALEEAIPLAKTETRLSRNLGRPELREYLGRAVVREGGANASPQLTLGFGWGFFGESPALSSA